MKFNLLTVASAIFISATVVSSQTPGWPVDWYKALPSCAIDCAVQAANSVGCKIEDYRCFCKNIVRIETIFEKCILSNPKCTNADIIFTEKLIRSLCFNCTATAQPSTAFPTSTIRV